MKVIAKNNPSHCNNELIHYQNKEPSITLLGQLIAWEVSTESVKH
jgi:hypothetical protein